MIDAEHWENVFAFARAKNTSTTKRIKIISKFELPNNSSISPLDPISTSLVFARCTLRFARSWLRLSQLRAHTYFEREEREESSTHTHAISRESEHAHISRGEEREERERAHTQYFERESTHTIF
jgi:hypothetical protein